MNQDSTAAVLKVEARKLFAQNGFDATTVRAITRAADANLGAITYHFGSKQALYEAVLKDVFDDLASRVERAAFGPGDPVTRLRAIVTALFAFFRNAPDAPFLIIREIAGGTPPEAVVPRVRRVLAAISGVIEDGQRAGTFRPVAPFLGAFTLMSQSVWFAVMGRTMPAMLDIPVSLPDLSARVEQHIGDAVTRALLVELPHA